MHPNYSEQKPDASAGRNESDPLEMKGSQCRSEARDRGNECNEGTTSA
jgi:hypothetical protein